MASRLLVASTICTLALALQQATVDFCSAASIRLKLADDALYFMGGVYTVDGYTAHSVLNYIYSIPLNKSFSTTGLLASSDYLYQSASGDEYFNQGAFFTDPNVTTLYSFAGFQDPSSPTDTVLAYDVTTGKWSNLTVSGGALNYASRGAALEASSEYTDLGLSFFSGGWVNISGMVRFDASDPQNLKWTNETDGSVPLTLEGSMEFVRYGKSGALITFGGYTMEYWDPALKGWGHDYRDMATIGVYDIESSTWYNVTAEGSIPSDRSAFCTAVSAAPDDSSMQITLYGGWDLFAGHSMADIYVLSIPSFQWIQVTDQTNIEYSLFPGNITGRNEHKCKTLNDRTMLSVGGYVTAGNVAMNSKTCNSTLPIIRVLDTSTYKFRDAFKPDAEDYYVPDAVVEVIGGNGQGGATLTAPSAGFTDSALKDLFTYTVKKYTTSTTTRGGSASTGTASATEGASSATGSSSSSSSSIPSNGQGTSSSTSHTGAIAGGVVGGILALALIAGLAYFILRRRRRQAAQLRSPQTAEMSGPASQGPFYKRASELPSVDDIHHPPGGAYFKPGGGLSSDSPNPSSHKVTAPVEADAGFRGAEADSWSRQAPGRVDASELPG